MWDSWFITFALGIITGVSLTLAVLWSRRPKVTIEAEETKH